MSYIDLTNSAYSNLQQMAVYAEGDLTATTPGTDPIEVYGGFWAGNPVTENPSGSLAGISGEQTNSTFLSACASQLVILIQEIYTSVTNPSVTLINSGDVLFYPGCYYDGGSGIDYPDSITLTFDAKGDPNAQFILWSDYHFTFPNTSFVLTNGARAGNVFFAAISSSGYITITNSTLVTQMTIPCIIIATTITVISTGTSTHPLSVEGAIFSRKFSPSLGGNTNLTDDNTSAVSFSVNRTFAEYIGVISPTYVDLSTTSPSLSQFAILGLISLTTTSSTDTTIHVKDGYWYGGSVSSNPALVPEGILSGYNDGPAINPTTYTDEFDALTALINSPIVTVDYPSNPITNTTTTFYPNFYYSDSGPGTTYDNLTTLTFDAKNINNAQFFINAVSLIFNGTSFNLINGATAGNIFWISSDVSVSNSLVPGIIMSQYGLVDISLTETTPTILSGHIFSKQDVSVSYINNNTPSTLTIQAAPLSTVPPPPPAFIDVNITCPHSTQFTIITQGPFTTSSSNNTPIIIEDGYWYAPTNTSDPALTYIGDLSGYNDDPVIHPSIYVNEITALINEINSVTAGRTQTITNADTVFLAGILYEDDGSGLNYSDITITFNAKNDTTSQFFIGAGFFTFTNVTFDLINGATAGNIFWITGGNVSFATNLVPGIIITQGPVSGVDMVSDVSTVMNGHIYSQQGVSFTYTNTNPSSTFTVASQPISTNPAYPPVNVIDFSVSYPNLLEFAVLAIGKLATLSPALIPIVINNGYWYGNPETSTSNPALNGGTGVISGFNPNPFVTPTTYTSELNNLINDIRNVTSDYIQEPITSSTVTFYPEYLYKDNGTGGLSYSAGTTITLDGLGNSNSQFFINAAFFSFDTVVFTLTPEVNPSNIFWLSEGNFTITDSLVPGIIIAGGGGVGDFNATFTGIPLTMTGHIFSNGDISIDSNSVTESLTIEAVPFSIDPPPTPTYIDLNVTCPLSVKFAVLPLVALNTTSNPNIPITIENGYWYGNPVTSTPSDGLVGTGVLSGFNNDPAIHPITYENEYNNLTELIFDAILPYNNNPITISTELFYPEYTYKDDGTSGLEYDDQQLIFNANGNPDAQFFINAAFFSFNNVSFNLINGASEGNIFWISNGSFTIIHSAVPGIILSSGDVNATINVDTPVTMNGHIFSLGSIAIDTSLGTGPLTISSAPISNNRDPIVPHYINLNATCPDLIQFAVLTVNELGITTPSILPTIPIIIKDGYWFGNPVTTTPDDSLVGEGRLSGFNPNPATTDIYTNQLNALIAEIAYVIADYLLIVDNTTTTFYPEYLYQESGTGLEYNGATLTFDAKGNHDAQFFLNATYFLFINTSFIYNNGANPSNIFWLADDFIGYQDSLVPGIQIGYGLEGGVAAIFTEVQPTPTIINCHMFSRNVIYLDTSVATEQLTIQSDPIPPTYIDLQVTCPRLLQFAVISQTGSLIARAPTNTPTIISHGYWFGNPVDSIPDLVGEGLLKGYNNDPVKHPLLYQIELQALVAEILTITTDNIQPFDDTVTTFYPEILYQSTGIGGVIYDTTELTFDARGDPKAQFFINAVLLTINGISFNLKNQAQASNIFWLVGTIDVTNSIFPGIILSEVGVNITLDNNEPMTLNGHIFSLGNVDLYSNPDSDAQLTIISNPVSNKPPYPPFPTINLNKTYPNLIQFSVISRDQLFTSSPTDNTRPIVIDNGYWFGNPVNSLHPIINNGTYSGYNNGPAINPDLYSNELAVLRAEIFFITIGSRLPINPNDTFYPQYLYVNYDTVTPIPNPLPIDFADIELEFDAGGDPEAQFFIHGLTITFTGTTFSLINGAQPSNIFWVSDGYVGITNSSVPGIIIARGETENDGVEVLYNDPTTPMTLRGHIFSRSYIDLVSNAPTLLLNTSRASMLGAPEQPQLTLIAEPSYIPPPIPPEPPVVCYAKGTLILTKNGYVPIENMKAGDKVITNGKIYKNKNVKLEKIKTEPVLWVGKFKVNKLNSSSRPICITKNSLAKNFPFQNLYVSPNHSIIIDGEMVLAKDLINEITIYQDSECEDVEYYHLECENHSTVIANGIVSESYLNMDNRSVFENSLKIHRKKYVKPEIKKILLL